MLNTLGIIQLCQDPSSFASAAQATEGASALELVVRRVTRSPRLERLVVVVPDSGEGREWGRLAPPEACVHYGAGPNALAQCVDAVERYPARWVVRISPRSLLLAPSLIDRLARAAASRVGCDYIGYAGPNGRPVNMDAEGLLAEWLRADALRRANREAYLPIDRDQPSRYIYTHPEEFGVLLLPLPGEIDPATMTRTLDFDEDRRLTQSMYDTLGPEAWDWPRAAEFAATGFSHGES